MPTQNNHPNRTLIGSTLPLGFLLGLVFLVLKLTGAVAWPWVWVLAPFWIPVAMVAAGALTLLVLIGALLLAEKIVNS